MKGRRFYVLGGAFAMAAVAALALVLGVFLWNSNDAAGTESQALATQSNTDMALETASARASLPGGIGNAGGPSEGIQLHGHWTIEVRDPDGSLVRRREFDNDLSQSGTLLLAQILGRDKTVGVWEINMFFGGSGCGASIVANSCTITELNSILTASDDVHKNLQVTPPVNTGDPLVLSGDATATADINISRVTTEIEVCAGNIAPTTCASTGAGNRPRFTATNIGPSIPVLNGQGINVRVEISAFGPAVKLVVTENQPIAEARARITVEVQDGAGNLVGNDNRTLITFQPSVDDVITAVVTGTAQSAVGLNATAVDVTVAGGIAAIVLGGVGAYTVGISNDAGLINPPDATGGFP